MAGRIIAATAAAMLLSSCTSHFQPSYNQTEPGALLHALDCSTAVGGRSGPSDTSTERKGRVPEGFIPVDVVRCTWSQHVSPSAGMTTVESIVTKEHLSGDYTALLAALAEPSDRAHNVSCLDFAELVPELWLVNADGQAIKVQWPLDGCEHSKPDTAKALAGLTVTDTTTLVGKTNPW